MIVNNQLSGTEDIDSRDRLINLTATTPVFVPDNEAPDNWSGKFEQKILGEDYIPMISGWFMHTEQRVTGGYLMGANNSEGGKRDGHIT